MRIDTGPRAVKIQSLKQIFAVIAIIPIALAFYGPVRLWVEGLGISPWLIVIVITSLYLAYQLYFYIRDVEYFYASEDDNPGSLRLRHFQLRALRDKQFLMEIRREQFYSYQVIRKRKGLREYLILLQIQDGKIYKYPPISLTILKRDEKRELWLLLDGWCQRPAER